MTNNNSPIFYQPTPILLAVVGGSPQVITETLYGIYKKQEPLPEIIFVITTTLGAAQIKKHNISEQIENFRKDYNIQTPITLPDENIWVITDENHQQLDDAHTETQHNDMANFIIEKVRDLTQQETVVLKQPNTKNQKDSETKIVNTLKQQHIYNKGFKEININKKAKCTEIIYDKYIIHASIAGGRKSQTFLLGYAMSLFGRSHDTVSHVMVDTEGERCHQFFYPKPQPTIVTYKNPQGEQKSCDLSQINVSLANIPLVLISQNMPKNLLTKNRSYTDTIKLFQHRQEEPKIIIDMQEIYDEKSDTLYYNVTFSNTKIALNIKHMTYLLSWINVSLENDDTLELALAKLNAYASLLTKKTQKAQDIPEALLLLAENPSVIDLGVDNKLIFGVKHANKCLKEMAEILKTKSPNLDGFFANDNNPRKEFLAALSKELDEDDAKRYIPQEVDKIKGDKDNRKGTSIYALNIQPHNITFLNEMM